MDRAGPGIFRPRVEPLSAVGPAFRQGPGAKTWGPFAHLSPDGHWAVTGHWMGAAVNDDDFKKAARRLGDMGRARDGSEGPQGLTVALGAPVPADGDTILVRGELAEYHLAHAARADLCRRLDRCRACAGHDARHHQRELVRR